MNCSPSKERRTDVQVINLHNTLSADHEHGYANVLLGDGGVREDELPLSSAFRSASFHTACHQAALVAF